MPKGGRPLRGQSPLVTGHLHVRASMVSRILDFFSSIDGLVIFLTVVAGIGLLGYVGASWLIYLVGQSQYFFAAGICGVTILLAATSIARVPAALIVLFGSAMACGTGFLLGYSHVFMP
jgi:hypothetical protein